LFRALAPAPSPGHSEVNLSPRILSSPVPRLPLLKGGASSKQFQNNITQAMETLRILQHTVNVPLRVIQVVRHPLDVAATLGMRRAYKLWWPGTKNADFNGTALLSAAAQDLKLRGLLEEQVGEALNEVLELSVVDEHIHHLLQLDPSFAGMRWLTMAHEDTVADPAAAVRRLCTFADVEYVQLLTRRPHAVVWLPYLCLASWGSGVLVLPMIAPAAAPLLFKNHNFSPRKTPPRLPAQVHHRVRPCLRRHCHDLAARIALRGALASPAGQVCDHAPRKPVTLALCRQFL
jgi:hypothetical protein